MYSIGLDMGYTAVKTVLINEKKEIVDSRYQLHKGNASAVALAHLHSFIKKWGSHSIRHGGVTGQGSKGMAMHEGITWINESTALATGSLHLCPEAKSVMGIGGQSAVYITHLDQGNPAAMVVSMNAQCAAGTGAFLEEQVSRLGINLEDYSGYAADAKKVPAIAGRCSVFAKTDIVHHQQEGVPVAAILQGLAHALVKNYRANVVKKHLLKTPVLLTGGVAHHQAIVQALRTLFRLDETALVVAPQCGSVTALGAALEGMKAGWFLQVETLVTALSSAQITLTEPCQNSISSIQGEPLEATKERHLTPLAGYGEEDSLHRHECLPAETREPLKGCLGIDIGSTSTNVVFIDEARQIRSYQYLRTKGDPLEAIRQGLALVTSHLGENLVVLGVGTTGSGRQLAGKYVGADSVMDEITAQATAAHALDSQVDTIIEIGGQDSKFIRMEAGRVTDFEMNKICAAGTGSFIEEQAKKLNLPMENFSALALQAQQPSDLGDRCTVFIETSIAAALSRQESMENIAAGLAYSIVRNYLYKVVGQKPLGNRIFLQGGVAHNQAVVNAFRSLLGDRTVLVPPFFSVTGAYGAALITHGNQNASPSQFRGFHLESGADFIAQLSAAAKQTKEEARPSNVKNMAQAVETHYLAGYDPAPDGKKKTVGIPRVLFLHKLFPLFNTFFRELGFRVILSEQTHEETVALSQEYALDETCYPIKLINGHVAQLMAQGIDYLFMPSLYTMAHPVSTTRQNHGCVYMQCFPRLVAQTMNLEQEGVQLLSPSLSFEFGKQYMMKTLLELGKTLGKNKAQTALALTLGMKALKTFEKKVESLGNKALGNLDEVDFAFVLITRAYGVADPVLNMGIPKKLERMGYRVLTLSNLPAHDLDTSTDHPNLFWPFGQHILSGARLVKEHPKLVPIYLTNHGCGPDTVLLHYFKELMGNQPFLHLEVDEHFSDVGVITRLEAFVNSLKNHYSKEGDQKDVKEPIAAEVLLQRAQGQPLPPVKVHHFLNAPGEIEKLLVPHFYPYADFLAAYLQHQGVTAQVMPKTSGQSLVLGRQHTLTKEAITFTALAGDVLAAAEKQTDQALGFFLPTYQGAEVGGQYHRLIRQKLDESGNAAVALWAPFVEDLVRFPAFGLPLFHLAVAGDLVNLAPATQRSALLRQLITAVGEEGIHPRVLEKTARQLAAADSPSTLKLLALGEVGMLYNDTLNHHILKTVETEGFQVMRAPLSEALWLLWHDNLQQGFRKVENAPGGIENKPGFTAGHSDGRAMLEQCSDLLRSMRRLLGTAAPFEKDPQTLAHEADQIMGLYAGGFGRYRAAKMLGHVGDAQGIITLASLYENTGTILNILLSDEGLQQQLPSVLVLPLDSEMTETDQAKVDTYVYTMKERHRQLMKQHADTTFNKSVVGRD